MCSKVAAITVSQHLVYASSSSVYGANRKLPFSVSDNVDHPVSLYGATKKANELMAHSYAHLFGLPVTGLRFFTVYGPWGRPDMSLFQFTRNILEGKPIPVFNYGHHARDFTYIDDVVEGVVRTFDTIATPDPNWRAEDPDPATSSAPYRLYNIGNHSPVKLLDYIAVIEQAVGRKAELEMLPAQAGDVRETYADVAALKQAVGFEPATTDRDRREALRRLVSRFLRGLTLWASLPLEGGGRRALRAGRGSYVLRSRESPTPALPGGGRIDFVAGSRLAVIPA